MCASMQTEALRNERAATEESLQAERAAKYAADQEAAELQQKIAELENSLGQERYRMQLSKMFGSRQYKDSHK